MRDVLFNPINTKKR